MIIEKIAAELGATSGQIKAAVTLLDDGATVPFIARYRKEITQGLDDIQLRKLEQRLGYLRELEARRAVILRSISEQGKLSDALAGKINSVENKTELEDLYLPFKPRRRTKGQIAIEAGLAPLANILLTNKDADPQACATNYVDNSKGIEDIKAALDGVKFILMEEFAENASVLMKVRQYLLQHAHFTSKVVPGKEKQGEKFRDYFNFSEKLSLVPSHRALAIFRGRNEGMLQVTLDSEPANPENKGEACERIILHTLNLDCHTQSARDEWLKLAVVWTWRVKISQYMETELFAQLREKSESEAIDVFAKNLQDLLMAAPAGPKVTLGLDPGLRTGVKTAVLDATGKVLSSATIFPHQPQNQWDKSLRTLANICKQHKVELVSIGNGTGSRETDKLVGEMMKANPDLALQKLVVSEAGASVYSASELASNELPDLNVSIRGAVSIARRLQDPLAELVKIEPKAIGVGQYQHDVNQSKLATSLDTVIEDCVNAVGVDLNTASPALLAHVSGLNKTLANNIVYFRDTNGAFTDRSSLKKVARLGPKAYEQAAGFLRVMNGKNPLDKSAVHPEAYEIVTTIIAKTGGAVNDVLGNKTLLQHLDPKEFVTPAFGLPTITDIISELEKPGRDPRPEFKTAKFNESVSTMNDLEIGMVLEGVVSNVANFGAFVDIGVHQDGLVHISAITSKFIKDPREVVKTGDIVKVKVTEFDISRKRISLTMRLDEPAHTASSSKNERPQAKHDKPSAKKSGAPSSSRGHASQKSVPVNNAMMGNAFADAFAKAKK
ncbi:RNA-binding transcriptional accessory protein [Glaciecola punicea]|uniref:Tex family protein n=1 Tax=Glaciecola punicea TaxID=56804 RepID=UPI00087342F7|nr:Tex family protein [Glaciecola punicea]OFA31848.1 RNA-binding transcriptional accessory protein [Glaciecola punicea]